MKIVFLRRASRWYSLRRHVLIKKVCERGYQVAGIVVERVSARQEFRDAMAKVGFRGLIRKVISMVPQMMGLNESSGATKLPAEHIPGSCEPPVYFVKSHNSAQCIALLRSLEPDLILLLGCGIIRQPVLSVPRIGTLNAHYGRLPDYRGVYVTEWAALNGDRPAVSVHFVSEGIDTGAVLATREVPFGTENTLADIREKSAAVAAEMFLEVLDALDRGKAQPVPQKITAGLQYFAMHPRLRAIAEVRLRRIACQ